MQSLTGKSTGDSLTAAQWNQLPQEVQNVITQTGQSLTSGDLNQLGKGVAAYVANGSFYIDSGSADAYVVAAVGSKQAPPAYTNGMQVSFIAGNDNTGASTVNVASLGVKTITGMVGGEIKAGQLVELKYNTTSGEFDLVTAAQINQAQTFTKGQRGQITTLTDGATITPDFDDSNNFTVTLGGNRTLANPTNAGAGQSGSIFVIQDGAGSRTLAFGANWKFTGGSVPTASTDPNAIDRIDYIVKSATEVQAVMSNGVA